jgi:hypothetical protein
MVIVLVLSGHDGRNVVDAQTNPHAYFNALVTRPEHYRSWSLRDHSQLLTKSQGGLAQCDSCPLNVTYDPASDPDPRRQDAAKLVIPAGAVSLRNFLYLPVDSKDGHNYLVTWDAWWGAEFDYGNTNIASYKAFQFGSQCVGQPTWFEVRSRFSLAGGAAIATIDGRSYNPAVQPMAAVGSFTIQPERWTRYWVLLEQRSGNTDLVSLWAADTQTDPVKLIDRAALNLCNTVNNLWIEYNTSSAWTQRPVGPLVSYLRNFAMLRDVASPTSLLQRPNAGIPLPPPPTPTAPSAPKNLRIVSP